MHLILLPALLLIRGVTAHLSVFNKGMYCLNGLQDKENLNSFEVVQPLFNLTFDEWFLHGRCKGYPPADGQFLELTAGGVVTVEISANRGQTTLSNGGKDTSDWPDGKIHPDDMNESPGCITSPNMHTQNQSMAAGTAFAISYTSDISAVTPENLVVFTVLEHTPWKRIASYQVPAAMPACPPGGCICAWGWVPNGCGTPNMYQNPYRCMVIGATSTIPVGKPQPPVWCEDDPSKCVKGPKQMIAWNQLTGDNIKVYGFDLSGQNKSPAYNTKCGFWPGAQNDIFEGSPAVIPPPTPSTSQDTVPSSEGVPTPTSTSSVNTLPNDTIATSTSTSRRSRPSRFPRSTLEETELVKKSIGFHLKRRRFSK